MKQIGTMLFLAMLIFYSSCSIAQERKYIDSLFEVIAKSKQDSDKVIAYIDIGYECRLNQPDSAITFYKKALDIALKGGMNRLTVKCYNNIGNVLCDKGDYDGANENYNRSLAIAEKEGNKKMIAKCFINFGIVKYLQGIYDKAIGYFQNALKIYENSGDKFGMSKCYINIGNIHFLQKDYKKSLDYYSKAYNILEEMNDKSGMASCLGNIGLIYHESNKIETAIEYYTRTLHLYEEIDDKFGIANCYVNMGDAYYEIGQSSKALECYQKSLKIDEELGDKFGIAIVNVSLSKLNTKLKRYNEALVFAVKGYEMAKEISALLTQKEALDYLSGIYDSLGNYKKAYEYHKLFKKINDSIFNENSSKQIKQVEAQYQNEKKQQQILLLNKDKELQNTEISRQKAVKNYLFGLIGLILVIVIIVVMAYFQKQKTNRKLRMLNNEISEQKGLIEIKNQNLSDANRIIESKNKNIMDSIRYAKRIQSAIFPPQELINKLIPDSFIVYKPKSIVSGDFYWLDQKDDHVYFATVDCTGHGVPGAFMSIVGYNILNQALNEKQLTDPGEILNFLSRTIAQTLRQNESDVSLRDGMDLVVCRLNLSTLVMEYAGAHNSLYLVRNNELFEYKTEKFQIGQPFTEKFKGYTSQNLELKKDDMLYLYSDGFMDQYNSTNDRKYTSKKFKDLLTAISAEPVGEQYEKLNCHFEEWKGKNDQTDDVTVFGLKI